MNLLEIIRHKVDAVGDGDFSTGLRAVLLHISTAAAHLERGQNEPDETAYTDAVYRCNQAFEGALKEAFRVLADKDPSRKTLSQIETYLTENQILRDRVLSQLTNYRKEWRNPSTHDYKLDFDSNEALFAIFGVSAFSIVLLNQIIEKLSHDKVVRDISTGELVLDDANVLESDDLLKLTAAVVSSYLSLTRDHKAQPLESLLGSLSGVIETVLADTEVSVGAELNGERNIRADLLVKRRGKTVLVEVKLNRPNSSTERDALDQVDRKLAFAQIQEAVVAFYEPGSLMDWVESKSPGGATMQIVKKQIKGRGLLRSFADAGSSRPER